MATKLIMMTVVDMSNGNNNDPKMVCLIHSLPTQNGSYYMMYSFLYYYSNVTYTHRQADITHM